jgi:hypothetical protein
MTPAKPVDGFINRNITTAYERSRAFSGFGS